MEYKAYEAACSTLRKKNQLLLDSFQQTLKAGNLSEKTVNKHISNVD